MQEDPRPVRPSLLASLGWLLLGSLGLYVGSFLVLAVDGYFLRTNWIPHYIPGFVEMRDYLVIFYWPLIWLLLALGL